MYSVIIPTIWYQYLVDFRQVLENLDSSDFISEIILIDNDPNFDESIKKNILSNIIKLSHIRMDKNIFVNPAWNKGVEISKSEWIVILNDDFWSNPSVSDIINWHFNQEKKEESLFGIHSHCYPSFGDVTGYKNNFEDESFRTINLPPIETTQEGLGLGWGCLLILNKKNWKPIPDELKIWCGDDFIYENWPNNNIFSMKNILATKYSQTCDKSNSEMIFIRENDIKVFTSKYKKY
jgi:hypothetical protein